MAKRPCPDDDVIQPIKKQQNSKLKSRKIVSFSSEKTLQLLYEGAIKCDNHDHKTEKTKFLCTICAKLVSSTMNCNYCETDICEECTNTCYKCSYGFCHKCSFPMYDQREAVCYSCYT